MACNSDENTPPPPAPTVTLIPVTAVPTVTPTPEVIATASAFSPADLPTYTPVVDEFLPASANSALDAVFALEPASHLVNLRRIRWRNDDDEDTTLNCDVRYHVTIPTAQEGYRIVVQTADDISVYLTDDDGHVMKCDEPALSIEGRPLLFDPLTENLVQNAKNDLIDRLEVGEAFVIWRDLVAVNWPDTSLGCPVPNATYEFLNIKGYWLSFVVDNVEYTYHSDGLSVKPCPNEQIDIPMPFATFTPTVTLEPLTPSPFVEEEE